MKTVWFSDLPKTEQENFKKMVSGSKKVLDKAKQVVYNMITAGESTSLEDYDSPSWAYRQADKNGYNRALKEVMNLLTVAD